MLCILFAAGFEPKLAGEAILGGIKVVTVLLKMVDMTMELILLQEQGGGGRVGDVRCMFS